MKTLSSKSLLTVSIYSIFFAALFKPASEIGMYEWMVRPSYISNILSLIFYSSITLFLFSSSLFLLKFLKKPTFNRKSIGIFAIYITFFFVLQFISLITDGQSFTSFISRLVLMFLILIVIVNYFQVHNDKLLYLWPIAITGGSFVIFNMILLYLDPSAVWPNSIYARMYGTTEHPNFFAMICALVSIVFFELIKNFKRLKIKSYRKVYFLALIIIFILSLLGVNFAGSRTALLFVIFSIFLSIYTLYRTTNGVVLFILIVLILSFSLFSFLDLILNVEGMRITSTENNRSGAWLAMISIFISNPFAGVGLQNVGYSENSYLRVLAASGLAGGGLFFMFVVNVAYRAAIKLRNKEFTSFSIFVLALLFTAIAEGFLTDSLSFVLIVFLYSVSAIFTFKKRGNI